MSLEKKLRLGIPKGSLEESTKRLMSKAGWNLTLRQRNYFPDINDSEILCNLCKAQEIPKYVESGVLDVGLSGKDWILETETDVILVTDLMYSKSSNKPARWVVAVAGDSPFYKIEDLAGKKIATELVGYTKKYFAESNIPVTVEYSYGATEAKVVDGLVDGIVEITETGATIVANGLRVIAELMQTNTQLIANKKAWNDPWKRQRIENISLLLKGALKADNMVCLKMNVPQDKMDYVMEFLPSMTSPTVAHLYNSSWLSIEIVVSQEIVRELIPKLRVAGAEAIIEYSLNKVI